MINLSKFLPFFILNIYRACLFFTNLDLFCIDNARVIYRKIRYLILLLFVSTALTIPYSFRLFYFVVCADFDFVPSYSMVKTSHMYNVRYNWFVDYIYFWWWWYSYVVGLSYTFCDKFTLLFKMFYFICGVYRWLISLWDGWLFGDILFSMRWYGSPSLHTDMESLKIKK